MPQDSQAPIAFDQVSLAFEDVPALEAVSFEVRRGGTKVLIGEAGSGKSVVLKLALGLLRPDSGRVTVLGQEVSSMPELELYQLRRHIGMVFQESALFDSLTVRENVAYPLEEEGRLDEAAIEARVRECLRAVELEEAIDKLPAELSGGMQRRVSIARAIATQPEIMLYDSPTAGLDPITASNIMEQIIRLRDVQHVSALLVTHRLQDAILLASRCWDKTSASLRSTRADDSHTSFLLLREGRVAFDGTGPELQASGNAYVKHFLRP